MADLSAPMLGLAAAMVTALLGATAAHADTYLACSFEDMPDMVTRYPDNVQDAPTIRVGGRPEVEMIMGAGRYRFETAQIDGYTFRFSPSNSHLDIEKDGQILNSGTGACVLVNGPVTEMALSFNAAEPQPVSVDTPAAQATGNWRTSLSTSNFDDSQTVVLSLDAEEPIAGPYGGIEHPSLYLRCKENTTVAYFIVAGHFLSDIQGGGRVDYRIDKEPVRISNMSASSDNKALGLWSGGRSIPLIKSLMSADRLFVRVTPFNESPREFSFGVEGLAAAIEPLRSACKW